MIEKLISVLMDDYKDASMLVDYAFEAKEHGHHELSTYFASRAKHRLADAKEVERHIDDMGDTDKIHKAYKEYHDAQCEHLKKKIEKLL
jgi:hypothetical protein